MIQGLMELLRPLCSPGGRPMAPLVLIDHGSDSLKTLAVGVRQMCPYCGPGVGVEVLESVSGGTWQRCATCGHVWIQPKGPDAFAAIVDHPRLRPVSQPEEDRPGSVRRALRFQVRLPLQFRVTGEPTWKTGHTENLSRSGMLIRTSEGSWLWTHYLNPGARPPMEVILWLPAQTETESQREIHCDGEVVRTVAPPGANLPGRVAAAIWHYRFGRSVTPR